MSFRAKSRGLSLPCFWNCLTRPGWPTDARSGGRPPASAVESTVGVLSPAGLYLTLTFGYCLLKAETTRRKFFCFCATQMPTIEMLPLTFELAAVVLLPLVELELLLLLPQPATSAASAATASTVRIVNDPCFVFIQMLLSPGRYRCPGPFPDQRNAGCGCPRRPPPRHPPRPASAARTGPRSSPSVRSPPARLPHSAHLRLRPVLARPRSEPRVHPPQGGS